MNNEGNVLFCYKYWIKVMGIWFFRGRIPRCMLLRQALSILLIYYQTSMNFLQLLSSGASRNFFLTKYSTSIFSMQWEISDSLLL